MRKTQYGLMLGVIGVVIVFAAIPRQNAVGVPVVSLSRAVLETITVDQLGWHECDLGNGPAIYCGNTCTETDCTDKDCAPMNPWGGANGTTFECYYEQDVTHGDFATCSGTGDCLIEDCVACITRYICPWVSGTLCSKSGATCTGQGACVPYTVNTYQDCE